MAACSNPRCTKPKPGNNERCLNCRALLTDTLVRHRYRIEKTMGRGGFGTTYLSRDQDRFNEPCLLKELNPESDEDETGLAERLFKREAQVLLNLRHRGIPKLHAYFTDKDHSYLVQDYIPGRTLAEEVDERKRTYNEQEARELLYELAEILEYLHTHNPPIIHRDIKPQNLMRHSSGRLLLIDFGAVCQAASSQTLIGSPGYVPSEQVLGRPVPQSDLYAAGATALRLLSGLHPSQLFNHRTKELEWQSHLQLSSGFTELINELVAQKVANRLASATELKQRLEALKVEPVVTQNKILGVQADHELSTEMFQGRKTELWQIPTGILGDASGSFQSRLANPQSSVEKGKLSDTPFLFLLRRFYRERFTGLLNCIKDSIAKTIYFDQGAVVFAKSTLKSERLGEMLVRIGRISIAEFEEAAIVFSRRGIRIGAALIELGYITPEELRPLIVTQVSNMIYSLFDWTSGEYSVRPEPPPNVTVKISVSTADLIFEGLRRMENIELVMSWVGSFTRKLTTTTDPLLLYQIVNLNPKEAFIVSRIESSMSIEEILALGGLTEADTVKTICGLLTVGILEWVVEESSQSQSQSLAVATVFNEPQPLPSNFDIQTAAEFCYEVENILRQLDGASHYAVLGISNKASQQEIQETYTQLAKKFHPDRHAQLVNYNLSLRAELEKIFTCISEAYTVLSNREMRLQYDKSRRVPTASHRIENRPLPAPTKPPAPKNASPVPIGGSSTPAQDWFRKGLDLYNAAQYDHASRAFWAATNVAPQDPEYRIYLARCLAMLKGYAKEAEQEFLKAIELAPNNCDYYVQLGLFYQKISLFKKAAKIFDKALELHPSHPLVLRAKRSLPAKEG